MTPEQPGTNLHTAILVQRRFQAEWEARQLTSLNSATGAPRALLDTERSEKKTCAQSAQPASATGAVTEPLSAAVAEACADRLWAHLETCVRGELQLLAVSLTFPSWRRPHDIRQIGEEFARRIAEQPGCGALMVFDVSKSGRLHFYSIFLSPDGHTEIETAWCKFCGALPQACKGKRVSGQAETWSRAENTCLGRNLGRVLQYAFKELPSEHAADWTTTSRVIASGVMATVWSGVCGDLGIGHALPAKTRVEPSPEAPKALHAPPGQRLCAVCGGSLPHHARKDAEMCSPRCRQARWRQRHGGTEHRAEPPKQPTQAQPTAGAPTTQIDSETDHVTDRTSLSVPTLSALVFGTLRDGAGRTRAQIEAALAVAAVPFDSTTLDHAIWDLVDRERRVDEVLCFETEEFLYSLLEKSRDQDPTGAVVRCLAAWGGALGGLNTVARFLGYSDAMACPWASLTKQQVGLARAHVCGRYARSTRNLYLYALRRVLRAVGRNDLWAAATLAGEAGVCGTLRQDGQEECSSCEMKP